MPISSPNHICIFIRIQNNHGNKMAVVIWNNHSVISVIFSSPREKALNTFKREKQLFFSWVLSLWHFPGNYLTKTRIICYKGPRMLLLQHRCHCRSHSFTFRFSVLFINFTKTPVFIPRTPRKHISPRRWVKFFIAEVKFISHCRYYTPIGIW